MQDFSHSTFALSSKDKLTMEQQELAAEIQQFILTYHDQPNAAVFVLEGDAGTGKSVLLNALFTSLQAKTRTAGWDNKLLVNHNEMLKIYKEIAGSQPDLRKKDFMKPTPFINQYRKLDKQADVLFIDEAHLLLTRSDPFNKYEGQNQLADLMQLTKVIVLVFDPHQVMKLKSFWQPAMLQKLLTNVPHRYARIEGQQRMQSPAVTTWIDELLQGKIQPLPQVADYDLQVFADGLPLYEAIKQRDAEAGLSRLIATADFPFTVLDGRTWYVTAGKLKLPWDKINFTDRPWAERPETLDEVGSIYTIQGFDLNYAGVIIGPSIKYDPINEKIVIDPLAYEDHEAFKRRGDALDSQKSRIDIVRNSLNILLKRGRKGLYLYACDENLRKKLLAASN